MTNAEKYDRPFWLGSDSRGWDHVRVHVHLLKDERIGANELAVYLGLAAHAELRSGDCFPALKTLAKYTKLHDRTVSRAIRVLEEAGYVRVDRDSNQGGANHYKLLPPPESITIKQPDLSTPLTQSDVVEPPTQNAPARIVSGTPDTKARLTRTTDESYINPLITSNARADDLGPVDNFQHQKDVALRKGLGCLDCDSAGVVEDDAGLWSQCRKCNGAGFTEEKASA